MNDRRDPMLDARGFVLIEQLVQSTGLEPGVVRGLIESGRVEGLVDVTGRAVGAFDDVLPSSEELISWGLPVSRGYRPEELRSFVDDTEDPVDDPDDADGPTWTMSW